MPMTGGGGGADFPTKTHHHHHHDGDLDIKKIYLVQQMPHKQFHGSPSIKGSNGGGGGGGFRNRPAKTHFTPQQQQHEDGQVSAKVTQASKDIKIMPIVLIPPVAPMMPSLQLQSQTPVSPNDVQMMFQGSDYEGNDRKIAPPPTMFSAGRNNFPVHLQQAPQQSYPQDKKTFSEYLTNSDFPDQQQQQQQQLTLPNNSIMMKRQENELRQMLEDLIEDNPRGRALGASLASISRARVKANMLSRLSNSGNQLSPSTSNLNSRLKSQARLRETLFRLQKDEELADNPELMPPNPSNSLEVNSDDCCQLRAKQSSATTRQRMSTGGGSQERELARLLMSMDHNSNVANDFLASKPLVRRNRQNNPTDIMSFSLLDGKTNEHLSLVEPISQQQQQQQHNLMPMMMSNQPQQQQQRQQVLPGGIELGGEESLKHQLLAHHRRDLMSGADDVMKQLAISSRFALAKALDDSNDSMYLQESNLRPTIDVSNNATTIAPIGARAVSNTTVASS